MKVCGFSFIRNGVQYDFPFREAYKSAVPLCDKMIIAAGNSTDNTTEVVRNIDPKIQVIDTVWDDSVKEGGRVFALETDKAFQAIPPDYDWAFYIQGDEVIHEKYYPVIMEAMRKYKDNPEVDGLLFKYIHFFGSYEYVGTNYGWYRREIRIIKNNKDIYSYRDAQGFRKKTNQKLRVKLIDAYIYHYGWVRKPDSQQQKFHEKIRIHYGDNPEKWTEELKKQVYDYEGAKEPVKLFRETHPKVMEERIASKNWDFYPDPKLKYASSKDKFKRLVFKFTGWYPGEYRNYKII